jgi:hypothetical protein
MVTVIQTVTLITLQLPFVMGLLGTVLVLVVGGHSALSRLAKM